MVWRKEGRVGEKWGKVLQNPLKETGLYSEGCGTLMMSFKGKR